MNIEVEEMSEGEPIPYDPVIIARKAPWHRWIGARLFGIPVYGGPPDNKGRRLGALWRGRMYLWRDPTETE